ncbi:hypothetical protein SAMN05421812_119132 [Asanoa hainanensis]|uniref:Uncharacterized protein n=1 Tax=Asanoa hainanensis TaxID=560556 RepID=A0A239PEI1_9ACTN|nr:hypothetical protein [Asanoa hainanensis]SNT65068.1 hypothetical protein SAMN05421812_119132 [Asanoa hainanensis]
MSNDRIPEAEQGEPIDVTPPVWAASPDSPDEEDGPRPPMSRRRRIVLASVAAVGVAGLAAVGIWGGRIASQQDPTMTTPATVAGLQLNKSADAAATAEDLKAAFAAGIDLKTSLGAVYTDPAATDRSVLFFGGTALLWSPAKDLDTLFGLVGDESGTVDGLHEVPAGDLGGVMKCGTTAVEDGGNMAVCGWADHGATGMALFPSRSTDEAAGLMRQMRDAVQSRD